MAKFNDGSVLVFKAKEGNYIDPLTSRGTRS